jgi:hypothetical protein
VNKVGHDSRFDEVKHQPLRFFVFWTLQVRVLLVRAWLGMRRASWARAGRSSALALALVLV